jgi:hypothetical protein
MLERSGAPALRASLRRAFIPIVRAGSLTDRAANPIRGQASGKDRMSTSETLVSLGYVERGLNGL